MSDEIKLRHARDLLLARLVELENFESSAQSRESIELDQSKVGRLSRMDALQQQAMLDANRARGRVSDYVLRPRFEELTKAYMAIASSATS